MKVFTVLFIFSALLFFVSCAPLQAINSNHLVDFDASGFIRPPFIQREAVYISEVHHGYIYDEPFYLYDYDNESIRYWLSRYSIGGDREDSMRKYLELSGYYGEAMAGILRAEGLPANLLYVAMAESKFEPCIKSKAKPEPAVGYWQFMPTTADSYGLKVYEHYIDERCDFELSTRAAARFLRDLYNHYEDWFLTLAGYNMGQTALDFFIEKYNSKDFWHFAWYDDFSKETRLFVPRVIAMGKIALNPERYGFYNIDYDAPLKFKWGVLDRSLHLSDVARSLNAFYNLNISYYELQELNAKFITGYVPVEEGQEVYIRIPL